MDQLSKGHFLRVVAWILVRIQSESTIRFAFKATIHTQDDIISTAAQQRLTE